MLVAISWPETNEYFSEQVLKTVSQHLLDIVAGIRLDEFVAEIVELVEEVAGYKLLQEISEQWKILVTKIMVLSRDPDFRTASYSRQFLEVSTIYDIITSFSLI